MMDITLKERAAQCWNRLELGPGWEKRLTAKIEGAIRAAVAEAVAEEREACAQQADIYASVPGGGSHTAVIRQTGRTVAERIRARVAASAEEDKA